MAQGLWSGAWKRAMKSARKRTISRLLGLGILLVVIGGSILIKEIRQWPLKQTAVGREILAEQQEYVGPECSRRIADATKSVFRGEQFDCRCVFDVLLDHQVPLRQLMTSEKRDRALQDIISDCG